MSKYLSISLSAVIFLIFLFTLFGNAINVPSFDDYDTTLNFIRRFFFDTGSFSVRKDILLSRHNEHRILFSKSCAAIYYSLFDQLSFRNLVLIQNIFLLGFFALLLRIISYSRLLSPEIVLISSIFLFSLAFWQVTFYYWGGIQHYTVFFFSFLSLYTASKADKLVSGYFFLSLIAATLAVLSFGNGFIALFLGGFILLIQRKWAMLGVWAVLALIMLGVTFLHLPTVNAASKVPFNIEWMARLLFTFLGSFVYLNPGSGQVGNIVVCMGVGFIVMLTWLWLFLKGYAFKNPLLYSMLSLPILTGIIVAISRFDAKAGGGIAPRYMFFTATIPIMLVLIFLDLKIIKPAFLKYIAGFGLVLWGFVYFNNLRELKKTNNEVVTTIWQWQQDHSTPLVYYRDAAAYSEIMSWAVDNKVISIPEKSR
ncbi:hypothetical protein [Dyadobacter sp. Leaf189]|uniref:hypothetical protein n=1 Tax=Dyadobacter sp. Leaf189 TaxID=1736295 RepID=UPI0006F89849|nr:hypothetical protein [Dyadobacter sp. Leaf189]KQS32600.1 hypothetical protein ASG33_00305 [Dyadobacter sp. Leaf189]